MKYSEQGIIITRFSYSETSVMLKVFTKEHGLKSFLFQGAKKKKGVVLLPLSPIEFTCYQRDESHLAKMTDATLFYTFETIPFNPIKSTVIFYYSAPFSCLFLICCFFCSFSTLLAVLARAAFFLLLYSFRLFCLLDLVMTF